MNKCKMKMKSKSYKTKHQQELLDANTFPEFNIAVRFALAINTVWCTMTYSAGMPILNLAALMYFVFAYFSDRFLLRGSRNPPQYDTAPAMAAYWWCLYATVLHLGIAVWIYGNPEVFPSKSFAASMAASAGASLGNLTKVEESEDKPDAFVMFQNEFPVRMASNASIALTLLLVLMIVFLILRVVLHFTLGNAVTTIVHGLLRVIHAVLCPCRARKKSAKVSPEGVVDPDKDIAFRTTYRKSLALMSQRSIASYQMRANPTYRDLLAALDSLAEKQQELRKSKSEPGSPKSGATPAKEPESPPEAKAEAEKAEAGESPPAEKAEAEAGEKAEAQGDASKDA